MIEIFHIDEKIFLHFIVHLSLPKLAIFEYFVFKYGNILVGNSFTPHFAFTIWSKTALTILS